MSTTDWSKPLPAPVPQPEVITEDKIKNFLELRASGKQLQRRWSWHYTTPNDWVDIPIDTKLSSLMQWLIQGMQVREAPPKPRSIWAAEYRVNGKVHISGSYISEAQCLSVWDRDSYSIRAVEFVEKMD